MAPTARGRANGGFPGCTLNTAVHNEHMQIIRWNAPERSEMLQSGLGCCVIHACVCLTNLSTVFVPSCDLAEPLKLVTVRINTCGLKSALCRAAPRFTPFPAPLPLHLASRTRAHTSEQISACTKCIRPKWTRVCYVLLGGNTDRRSVGPESAAAPTGICDIMTGGERPVKIRLHIWSVKLLLSFLEMSLKCKYYK